ncbi:MAG TPA: hypothetical protein VIM12_18420 [Noviherbaspirillum sp.]|uniref:hypothetical protein n=1 Tax=Noviherbaspirillum sp. TaxID=1926288 RepID=UPI002F9562F0
MTTRSKRWNGKFENLPTEFLKAVLARMGDYGDRVQFSLVTGGPEPAYQVINADEKKIAFDGSHHLLRVEGDEFSGTNVSAVFSTEQVKAAIAGMAPVTAGGKATKAVRSTGTRASAARLEEQCAAQRYEYFRNHRQSLPAGIAGHTEEITTLMKQGKSVEEAFDEVVRKYF